MSNLASDVDVEMPVAPFVPGSAAASVMGAAGISRRSADPATAKARCAVADYLRDLGLRDPDVVVRESHRIVSQARSELQPAIAGDETLLSERAIQLTVKKLEHWLVVLAVQADSSDEPERLGSVIAARLSVLLDQFPQALNQSRVPAELVGALQDSLTPVVPPPRRHRMRRQMLALVPSSWKRLWSRIRGRLVGREA